MRRAKKTKGGAPESMKCTICGNLARMVAGVRPRACVECVVWPPGPEAPAAKTKGRRR